uniref:Uncharacterized protein n=1 Tax=Rangifer tarandus platyrhynchus TaxID=3082113 RepID=A0ACB0DZI5_RANTA|nr:unnamed protein product [Rangifer tarandus platyrhynchus]
MPQALLAPSAPSPGGVCFPDFRLPREEEKVATSPETPPHSQAQHSPRITPRNIATTLHVYRRDSSVLSLLTMTLKAAQGSPEVWPTALEPAYLGSHLAPALYWLLTFSRGQVHSGPQRSHLQNGGVNGPSLIIFITVEME